MHLPHQWILLALIHFLVQTAYSSKTTCPQVRGCLQLLKSGKKCPLFPMLPGSVTEPPGEAGFTLTKLRSGVYHYNDDAYHALLVYSASNSHLVVIDFPRSPNALNADGSSRLNAAVRALLKGRTPNRVDMVYSHRHLDHIGLAPVFLSIIRADYPDARVEVWASVEVRRYLSRRGFSNMPSPTVVLYDRARKIVLSPTLTIHLSVVGGHTPSDLLAYIPPSRKGRHDGVVHFVDVISAREAPFEQFTLTVDLWDYMRAHERVLKLDFAYISTGHGRIGSKQDVRTSLRYARFVIGAVRKAAAGLGPADTAAIFTRYANPRDSGYRNGAWTLKAVLDLQVAACVRDVIAEWGCKLSVVDVFVEGHCMAAALYLLVDQ